MKQILHQNQESILLITKSLNQYANFKAQTSDESQLLEIMRKTVLLFLMICCHQNKKVILI